MTFVSKYCHNVIYGSENKDGNVIYNGVEDPRNVTNDQIVALKSKLQINKDEIVFLLRYGF